MLVQQLPWQPIRPAFVLGCLSLQGPLGLLLGFYHAWVWCLDITLFDSKFELGATKYGRSILPPCSPCFIWVFGSTVGWLQAYGTLSNVMSLGVCSITRQSSRQIPCLLCSHLCPIPFPSPRRFPLSLCHSLQYLGFTIHIIPLQPSLS